MAFFVIIVILPTIIAAALLIHTNEQLSVSRVDVRLNESLDTINRMYRVFYRDGLKGAAEISHSPRFQNAWATSNRHLYRYLKRMHHQGRILSVAAYNEDGETLWKIGRQHGMSAVRIENSSAAPPGRVDSLEITTVAVDNYIERASRLVNYPLALTQGDKLLATTWNPQQTLQGNRDAINRGQQESVTSDEVLPLLSQDTLNLNGEELEIRSTQLDTLGESSSLYIISHPEEQNFLQSSPFLSVVFIILIILIGGLLIIFRRGIQTQLSEMVDGAKRIAQGDFSKKIPVVGTDEMSQLAEEFNQLSSELDVNKQELDKRMAELAAERSRAEMAIRSVGQAMASGLDRQETMAVFMQTAQSITGAVSGAIISISEQKPERKSDTSWKEITYLGSPLYYRFEMKSKNFPTDINTELGKLYNLNNEPHLIDDYLGASIEEQQYILLKGDFQSSDKDLVRYLSQQTLTSLENIRLHELISKQAMTDSLTKLNNRRAFKQTANRLIENVSPQNPLSLILFDIDNFKKINDTWGHDIGDNAIQYVAETMRKTARDSDYIFRYGGEEFVVLLPDTKQAEAIQVAERLRTVVETTIKTGIVQTDIDLKNQSDDIIRRTHLKAVELPLTVSLGLSTTSETVSRPSEKEAAIGELLAKADELLYQAKHSGKNCLKY